MKPGSFTSRRASPRAYADRMDTPECSNKYRSHRTGLLVLASVWFALAVAALWSAPGLRLFPLVEMACISILIVRLSIAQHSQRQRDAIQSCTALPPLHDQPDSPDLDDASSP